MTGGPVNAGRPSGPRRLSIQPLEALCVLPGDPRTETPQLARGAALGAILAVVAIFGLHWPPESEALNGLALFLALTACVYPGALLAQSTVRAVAAAELGVAAAVFATAWLGLAHDPLWLAAGYLAHGIWDWGHHIDRIATRTARWFPPACALFDIVIAGYAAWLALRM